MWASSTFLPLVPLNDLLSLSIFILLVTIGAVLTIVGVVAFKRAQTTVNPIKPETSSVLVNTGIYRLTRNPMYVGMALTLTGWAFFLHNPLSLIFVVAFIVYMTYFQIKPEEKMLKALFKQQYVEYCAKVKRWI
ncbi:isoprenylcysteine carboxylmethyltransferase family protein [Thalassotalea sp. G2M2-11]|uniref:methyltransferase family protein n=1 Tax=Thalassotalea sp. G2M2-11 TaxID=2787627 RepID=UPI001F49443F|nr:isoprenylcysteine carboxylmethyltransferase family protein [Thalassotalea sp. G2M2-11]